MKIFTGRDDKSRSEEYNKLKVDLMLRESQEKTEQEKKAQEFREAEALASRKINDIRQKIEAEKTALARSLNSKDEEIKVFKIQAELKLKEIRDGWEQKKLQAARDMEALEKQLPELNGKFTETRARWQNELSLKNQEILRYEKEWQEKQGRINLSGEEAIRALKEKSGALETELAGMENDFLREKERWQLLAAEKESTLASLKGELKAKEYSAKNEIAALEAELSKSQEPLKEKVKEIELKIATMANQYRLEISSKEEQIRTTMEQAKNRRTASARGLTSGPRR